MNNLGQGLLDQFFGQLLALITFFLFPALQYLFLKISSRKDGTPELWYLPKYGFRLVIRNIPRNRILSDIKQRTFIRKIVPSTEGSSVATYDDTVLISQDDLFLFPGNDQILICFKLEGSSPETIDFVATDRLGNEKSRHPISSFDRLITEYTSNIENFLNFDIRLGKQAQLFNSSIKSIWSQIQSENVEGRFELDRIANVG